MLNQRPDETREAYQVRVLLTKELEDIDADWNEIATLFGGYVSADHLRKLSKGVKLVYDADMMKSLANPDSVLAPEGIDVQKQIILMRDERNEYTKVLRNAARLEHRVDLIEEAIRSGGEKRYARFEPVKQEREDENEMIVIVSDPHIGAGFNTPWGQYNLDIARERLARYRDALSAYAAMHRCEKMNVFLLGDMVSGNIHKSISVSNREDVVSQVMTASEMLSDFIYELASRFVSVLVTSVSGNHSRIDRKDDAVKNERLDRIIPWYIENSLAHIENVEVVRSIDNTVTEMTIKGHNYVGVHGDYDAFNETGVSRLMLMLGYKPYCVLYGHKHYPAMENSNGVIMVQGGALAGAGDDYTIEKRLCGRPCQTALVVNKKGIVAHYPIWLD